LSGVRPGGRRFESRLVRSLVVTSPGLGVDGGDDCGRAENGRSVRLPHRRDAHAARARRRAAHAAGARPRALGRRASRPARPARDRDAPAPGTVSRRDRRRPPRVTPTPFHAAARLARVRSHMVNSTVDALVVTHLPNVQYLTGFVGTAGAAIVLAHRCLLVVDFRYVTAAGALAASLDGAIDVETFDRSYDEAIVDLLRRVGASRIGIEAAYLPVARFNAISAGLAAKAPLPLHSSAGTPVLVATERLV